MTTSSAPRDEDSRKSEERYRFLFDMSPAAVYSIDTAGVIQEFNRHAAELWGREPALGDTDERFCGSYKLFRPDGTFMPHAQCPMAQVVTGEVSEVRNGEVIIERPDGSRITVIVNIRQLKGPDGEIAGAINCFYDITERSTMERERQKQNETLAEINRRKDEFLAILSHELRNPLGPITNSIVLMAAKPNDLSIQENGRAIIGRQTKQLTSLINDLLDLSRVNSGRVHLERTYLTINTVVESAVETVRHLIDVRRHELVVSLPDEPVWLYADSVRLQQIIVNLLGNAVKYTENGKICLSAERIDDKCSLRVRDTGIGISESLLPHIFEMFTQADEALTRAKGGLGIGLALVKRLVEMHQGQIEAHSVLGEGSEFVLTMPGALSAEQVREVKRVKKGATQSALIKTAASGDDLQLSADS